MATYDQSLKVFRLDDSEFDFAIPATLPDTTPTPANTGIVGNGLANTLTGDKSNNVLDGKAGADRMAGGLGDDIYYVDDAGDIVLEDVNGPGEGYDTVIASISYVLSAGIEKLQAASGTAAINLTGNDETNSIVGNDGANVIYGGRGGADMLEGRGGNDIYYVDHNDRIVEAAGGGTDQAYAIFDFRLPDHIEELIGIGPLTAKLTGNAQKNLIVGTSSNNVINGGSGNDVLYGGTGRDTFAFDTRLGSYRTDRTVNFDRIMDFEEKDDTILLDRTIFRKFSAPGIVKKAFFTIGDKAKDSNDFLIYNSKTGIISYDVDGSGVKQAVEFAKLDKGLALTNQDFRIL